MDSTIENSNETSRQLRALLPATSPRQLAASPPKRHRITMACAACRSRKTKCDGDRPQCQECLSRDSECHYTETETALLKRKHEDLEALFDMFRTFPEQEANNLLARSSKYGMGACSCNSRRLQTRGVETEASRAKIRGHSRRPSRREKKRKQCVRNPKICKELFFDVIFYILMIPWHWRTEHLIGALLEAGMALHGQNSISVHFQEVLGIQEESSHKS
ncbi:hypothetical protein FB567DRAFT_543986 [Paraphoma chrysanthemicola]|uniref:Zn(2)-C6 fungal-type domain-containing protein n=1 Tax=Paraphoma chrysanthemicola TaxID=798071 RepID=A0A8K0RIL6_9PLEO|nr:hypothetical protein FB567DRAFT_543986 [Paraphoma chrysanthemicola]